MKRHGSRAFSAGMLAVAMAVAGFLPAKQALAFQATGGTVTTSGGDTIHTFTSSGTLVVTAGGNVQILVVAGGGGAGTNVQGGGGAGGCIYNNAFAVAAGSYTVTVGAGGNAAYWIGGTPYSATNGGDSEFGTLRAVGGGAGASRGNGGPGGDGGSGGGGAGTGGDGGASYAAGRNLAGTGTAGQGNSGGNGFDSGAHQAGGGGGGYASAGTAGNVNQGGNGGNGFWSSISGTNTGYCGGGAGVASGGINMPPIGGGSVEVGAGGGGAQNGSLDGRANSGGGGGNMSGNGGSGNGGSGIVIIRTGGGGTPQPNVTIDTFTASPTSISPGASSTLSWSTTNATSVSIDQGVGGVALDASTTVTPGATTTYTLTAQGSGGPVTRQVVITVLAVSVDYFTATPATITAGQSATLSWGTTNATGANIDNSIGGVAVDGSRSVNPGNTTTYTIFADGPGGPATRQVTLTVLADSDGDGLPDTWETTWGLDPNDSDSDDDSIEDQDEDDDGDGRTNYVEYLSGSDPTVPDLPSGASGSGGISCAAGMRAVPWSAAAVLVWASLLCGLLLRRRALVN